MAPSFDPQQGRSLVVGMSGGCGLAVVRALANAGVEVHAAHHDATSPAFRTRAAITHVVPDWRDQPELLAPALVEIAAFWAAEAMLKHRGGGPTPPPASLFVCEDSALAPVAEASAALHEAGLRPAFSVERPMTELLDKRTQYADAAELGVSFPWTRWGSAAELIEAASECPYPVIVKPVLSHIGVPVLGAKAIICKRPDELRGTLERVGDLEVVVQELIPGGDRELFSAGFFITNEGYLPFTCRKLAQHPPQLGIGRITEAVDAPELLPPALALLRKLTYQGVAQVEFKRDHRDGSFRLMEANLRPWQWMGLAMANGVNLLLPAHRWAVAGESPSAAQSVPRPAGDRRWIWFLAEVQDDFIGLRHGALPDPRLWRRVRADSFLALRDPLPFLYEVREALRRKPAAPPTAGGASPTAGGVMPPTAGRRSPLAALRRAKPPHGQAAVGHALPPREQAALRRALAVPAAPLNALTLWALWRRARGSATPAARPLLGLLPSGPLLVLSPHPDDETMLCGATVAAATAHGERVCIAVMTAGDATECLPPDCADIATQRAAEVRAAAAELGVHDLQFWEFDDGGLSARRAELAARIADTISAQRPAWVVVPFPFDAHPDHVAAALALGDALGRLSMPVEEAPRILCAPALTPLDPQWVTRLVPAGTCWPCRQAAIHAHASRGGELFAKSQQLARLHPAYWLRPAEPFVDLDAAAYVHFASAMERDHLTTPAVRGHALPLAATWELLAARAARERIGALLADAQRPH